MIGKLIGFGTAGRSVESLPRICVVYGPAAWAMDPLGWRRLTVMWSRTPSPQEGEPIYRRSFEIKIWMPFEARLR